MVGMTRVLVVGNAAREHAIASALGRSPRIPELYFFMNSKNPGLVNIAKDYIIDKLDNFEALGDFVKKVGEEKYD